MAESNVTCNEAQVAQLSTPNSCNNPTIATLLTRRSIRKFKQTPIEDDIVKTLELVAQHAATSEYRYSWTALKITDSALKQALADLGNQEYIATTPLLYVFVADQHRNIVIAEHNDVSVSDMHPDQPYAFIQAQHDCVLALHAMETAAEALGLGCVILGSILNNTTELCRLLQLPDHTYPVLGLAIGYPDQDPSIKPRMPRTLQFFENQYPDMSAIDETEDFQTFDETVHQYYDLRSPSYPVPKFSQQIAEKMQNDTSFKQMHESIHKQGFNM